MLSANSSTANIDRTETTPVYRYRPPASPLARFDDRQRRRVGSSLRNFTHEERQFRGHARPRPPPRPSITTAATLQVYSVSRLSDHVPRTASPLDHVPMIEVAPGVALPVRSAKETQLAIRYGFYKSLACLYCTSSIGCILDADFVICPECLCVNSANTSSTEPPRTSGGVGLGFRL
jgi:hypothetical protein